MILKYFFKRILLVIPTFLIITLMCFTLTQFIPGGPVEQHLLAIRGLQGSESSTTSISSDYANSVSEEMRENLIKHYEFDKPLLYRYKKWLIDDKLGMDMHSYQFTNKTAWQLIKSKIPVSLWFGITGFLLSYLICIPLGITKALKHKTKFDFVSSVIVFIGYAIPPFALGMLLKMFFCGTVESFWDIFPIGGFESDNIDNLSTFGRFLDRAYHMFVPVICYIAGNFAVLTIMMKNSLLDQLSSDYIRTVLSKGASKKYAIFHHAMRNALIPIATGFGSIMTVMFAGSVVIEKVFEIPGMGLLSLEAIEMRDYPVFMGILSITSILGLLGQIVSDISYVVIDPRIKFSGK